MNKPAIGGTISRNTSFVFSRLPSLGVFVFLLEKWHLCQKESFFTHCSFLNIFVWQFAQEKSTRWYLFWWKSHQIVKELGKDCKIPVNRNVDKILPMKLKSPSPSPLWTNSETGILKVLPYRYFFLKHVLFCSVPVLKIKVLNPGLSFSGQYNLFGRL